LQQRSGQTTTLYVAWKNIGENLVRLGRLDDALDALHEADRLIDDPTTSVAAIVGRAIVDGELARENVAAARRQAIAMLARADPAAPPLFRARALLTWSRIELADARYNAAVDTVGAALQILGSDAEAVRFRYEVASDLVSMVLLAITSLPYDDALNLARRIDNEFHGLPVSLSNEARRAIQYRRRLAGAFDAVLREDDAALRQAREAGNVPAQVDLLSGLSTTYYFANDKRRAIALLEEAVQVQRALAQSTGNAPDAASRYIKFQLLARLLSAQIDARNGARARELASEITDGIGAVTDASYAAALAPLAAEAELAKASIAQLDRDFKAARATVSQALASSAMQSGRLDKATVFVKAADIERDMDEEPLLVVRYLEAAIAELHSRKDVRSELSSRLRLARYLLREARDRIPNALPRAQEQLQLVEVAAGSIAFADAQWRVQFLQGVLAEDQGRTADAIVRYKDAIAIVERLRTALSQQEQRQSFTDNDAIQELYARLIGLLGEANRKVEAWEYVERSKARSFLEMLHGRRFRGPQETAADAELHRLERQILDLRVRVTAVSDRGVALEPDMLRSRLNSAETAFALARQTLSLQGKRVSQELALRPLRMDQLQARLPLDTAIVEYAILEGRICAFVITHDRVVEAVWRLDMAELRTQIESARELLADPGSLEQLRPVLRSLSNRLIAPVLGQVPQHTRKLILIPSGVLHYVPFQVLPLSDGRDLIDRFILSYLPSASTLGFLGGSSGARDTGKVFLGAIGNVSVEGMPALPATVAEVRGIASAYPSAEVRVEGAFTYERLRHALLESSTVHVATHGVLDNDAPLFNAVLTSPTARQPSRLPLYELTNMHLKAKLVVLSACETGLGEMRAGDEITSLSRMLLQAGAETVVASLWTVSDRATSLLMKGFHQRLRAGGSAAEALRDSALSVRKQYPHPYYWAPFVLTGSQ
jgi:CHAT domain-containing protein/tetratricopeptide (TPR) repeat protein